MNRNFRFDMIKVASMLTSHLTLCMRVTSVLCRIHTGVWWRLYLKCSERSCPEIWIEHQDLQCERSIKPWFKTRCKFLPHMKEFRFLVVLLRSDGSTDMETGLRISALSELTRTLLQPVVMKMEQSQIVKLLIYWSFYIQAFTYNNDVWIIIDGKRSRIQIWHWK